jgi:integrase
MVGVWQQEKLAAATIQTYPSFLRGLSLWIGKAGFIKKPAFYGLTREEYERHEASGEDKSWSAHGIDIDALIADIGRYDPYVGASMRLIRALGLRRKEALMFRPHSCVVPFEATGLPLDRRTVDHYAAILVGSKGGRPRYIPLDTPERIEAVQHAQSLAADPNAHMGQPGSSLKQSMKRFMYVMRKFGITKSALGVTAHGLRHEALIEKFEEITGQPPPVRNGGKLPKPVDKLARSEIAELAGHARRRAANAYCGQPVAIYSGKPKSTTSAKDEEGADSA